MEVDVEEIKSIFLFGLVGIILLWIAKSRGFFRYDDEREPIPLKLRSLLIIFGIYFVMTMGLMPMLARAIRAAYVRYTGEYLPLSVLNGLELFFMLVMLLLFYLYTKADSPQIYKKICKNWSVPNPKPVYVDFFMGMVTWCIAIPLIFSLGDFIEIIMQSSFQYESHDQIAVRYLLESMKSPLGFVFALVTIIIVAPIIEEFLFRGNLLPYLKRYMSSKRAVFLSALCFGMFHYSENQGLSNIPLIFTLFLFGWFLGFIYERQASLYASIGLHVTFNLISTIRIILNP